ncbi:MAG: GSCFA domain-containing protein [Nitrosospira sp.]|nr:GSCFA domain-containing protein [Nitrosospira sp.]
MRCLAPSVSIEAVRVLRGNRLDEPDCHPDLVFAHPYLVDAVESLYANSSTQILYFPMIRFRGYHPDMVLVRNRDGSAVQSPTGLLHSGIAFFSYQQGLSAAQTITRFNQDNFSRLGYFAQWNQSVKQLLAAGRDCGMELGGRISKWSRSGCFMHTMNHPKLPVLADFAEMLVRRAGITAALVHPEDYAADELKHYTVWGVYPAIAQAIGLRGCYAFKKGGSAGRILDLQGFVDGSFTAYAQCPAQDMHSPNIDEDRFKTVFENGGAPLPSENFRAAPTPDAGATDGSQPYAKLPRANFWRRAVTNVSMSEVDPVQPGSFTIHRDDQIATAGSCFAQHIANGLQEQGYRHFIAEAPPPGMDEAAARVRNYGVFSARYGNLYTARQLVQLFDRAFRRFVPHDDVWRRADGRFVDPYRPRMEPEGFETAAAMHAEREVHLEAVRRMFSELDVFVFTLGLTEAWRSVEDGALVPLPPGVAGGPWNPLRYGFVNFSASEVVDDLHAFIGRLAALNPAARVLLTVSPVPLAATYENRHVLTSTTYSKSALRSAVEDVSKRHSHVDYFPSYEIITGTFNRGSYFDSDLRSVNAAGVAHVMRLFFKHWAASDARSTEPLAVDSLLDVVCEEGELDAGESP